MSKILLAGPWIGEFGWELFGWQGYLRKLSKQYDKVIVSSRPGHEFLYEDFCDEFIPYTTKTMETNGSVCKGDVGLLKQIPEHTDYIPGYGFDIGFKGDKPELSTEKFYEQEFIKYGDKGLPYMYDIIIHARDTDKCGSGMRSYPLDKWKEIVKHFKGLKIACIGTKEASAHIKNTVDLRNMNLQSLCTVLARSKVVVGPSSGPMHLASLCYTPHIIWTRKSYILPRYQKYWNPFNTKCAGLKGDNPDTEKVITALEKEIEV